MNKPPSHNLQIHMENITKTLELNMKTLPNECFVEIFARLCLQDLILLRAVSTRWRNIIEEELRRKRQGSLKLFGSLDDVKLYLRKLPELYLSFNGSIEYWSLKKSAHQSDDLIVNAKYFNIEACDLLVRLFPNVQHLLVCFSNIRLFTKLPYLIDGWSASLNNLSICGKYSFDWKKLQSRINRSINRLTSLNRLDVLAKDFFLERSNVIGKLKHLSLSKLLLSYFEFDYPEEYWEYCEDVLNQLGPQCTHLYLEAIFLEEEETLRFKLEEMSQVTHLSLFAREYASVFESVCYMNNLRYLCINCEYEDEFELFDSLDAIHKLKNLNELNLNNVSYEAEAYMMREHFNPFASVKVLSIWNLEFYYFDQPQEDFHAKQFCSYVSYMFPKLEQFSLQCYDEFAFGRIGQHFEEHFAHLQKKGLYLSKDEGKFVSENAGRHNDGLIGMKLNVT